MKYIDICAFYITARNYFVDLEQNSELKICYNCHGFNINCSKRLLVKITPAEKRGLERVIKQ